MKKYPRMSLSLTDEIVEELKALSKASGASVSSIVVDIITPALPSLIETRKMLCSMKSGDFDAAKSSIDSLVKITNDMTNELNEAVKGIDKKGSQDD
ncbi:hypothetical protein AB7Z54_21770 [Providencia manganoxydans]|uniref:hypothetical protein n=1 Tax=Providencia manganoxydans TaxID=2923283 RepID=UPI0034E5E3DE